VALGEDAAWMSGEAGSRSELTLPGNQEKLLQAVSAAGKPVVLIVFSGRPLVLNWAAQHVAAILEAWHPGIQAGPALVRVLYGEVNPSGKLTTSFPRSVGQEPLYYNALNTGRPLGNTDDSHPPLTGDDKYKSRYVDQRNTALFPFGFGLSYTTFSYTAPTVSGTSFAAADLNSGTAKVTVTAEVKNTGKVAGEETAQLYIHERGTSVALPVRELEGFQKVFLKPGESRRVEFTLGRNELAFWNIDMKEVVEPAAVTIWVAGSSVEGMPATFTIK
jgi:beta-glucosidase